MRNRRDVGCLLMCLHLWLAKSFSEIITQQKGDVCASKGRSGHFQWNDIMQHLLVVDYVFENKIIATTSSTNLSSVDIKSKRLNSRFQLLQADNVAFRIDNATEEDYGEYKIILTYSNGDERELVGRLRDFILGNFNITCDLNSTCTCGNQSSSGRYTWVFHHASGRREIFTNGSELEVTDLPKNRSFFCERHSDCQRSRCFNFTSGTKDYNLTYLTTYNRCRNLHCGEPLAAETTYHWRIKVDTAEDIEGAEGTVNTYELCRDSFECAVKCQRENDCSETQWMCFEGATGGLRKRALDVDHELLRPCNNSREVRDVPVQSSTTTIIAVTFSVIIAVIVAAVAVLLLRKKPICNTAHRFSEVSAVTRYSPSESEEPKDDTDQTERRAWLPTELNQTT